MADTKLLLLLVGSLVLGSLVTGVVIQSYESWNETGTDFYQEKCPPGMSSASAFCQQWQPTNTTTYYNFTSSAAKNQTWFNIETGFFTDAWVWNDGVGYISEPSTSVFNTAVMTFSDLSPRNGFYTTTYVINNSVKEDFWLMLEWYTDERDSIRLVVENDQMRIPDIQWGLFQFGNDYTYSYPLGNFNTNPISITTSYNPGTGELEVSTSYGAGFYVTIDKPFNIWASVSSAFGKPKYGGVGTSGDHVTVVSINPYIVQSNDRKTGTMDQIWGFWTTMVDLLTFQAPDIVPWWIVILFVYIPILAILAILVDMFIPDWL